MTITKSESENYGKTGRSGKIFQSIVLTIFGVLLMAACQPNEEILKSSSSSKNSTPSATIEPPKTSFEKELRDMQNVPGLDYIFVFRRKDGGVFDREDKKFLRENTPAETNRFVSADDDRAFIAGSAFRFSPENMKALKERFNVEDYSKPETKEEKPPANK